MGPVLGEPFPNRPYYPNDDRIVSIAMHLTVGPELSRTSKLVGLYWRHLELPRSQGARKIGRMIDYIVQAAQTAGAEKEAVRLSDLFRAYRDQFPDLTLGSSEASYSATLGFHTLNMKSRWNHQIPEESQSWVREPLFARVGRGCYRLLTSQEISRFRSAWAAGEPIVRADEFEIDDLFKS